jgi:CBS domain-containing protein
MAHLTREPRDPIVELKIAAVGPLTSLAVGGAFWLLASWFGGAGAESLWAAMLNYLGFINVALALFNLLPGFPLDGGRILRAVLWFRSKDLRRATASAARSGSAIGFGLMLFGVFEIFSGALVGGLWLILIGMFLRGAAGASYQSLIVEQVLSSAPVRDLMVSNPVVVPSEISVRQAIEDHFLRYGFGGFPVARNGDIEGIVSLREVKDCPAEKRDERRVRDIMVAANARVTIPAAASAADALKQMTETESGRLLVVDEGRPVGLVTQTGIARFIQIQRLLEEGEAGEI